MSQQKRKKPAAPDLMGQTYRRLECETVLRFFALKCQTDQGRRKLMALRPMDREAQKEHFAELTEWVALLERRKPLRLPPIPGPELFARNPHLKPFEAAELRDIGRLLRFWRDIQGEEELAFATAGSQNDPELNALTDKLANLFDPDGDWSENISPTYSRLIRTWVKLDRELEETMRALLRRYGSYLNEDIVFERNHRRVLAVKVDFRGRVKGFLHDYSSSGNTIYVEPEESAAKQNQLTQIESEIREELWRIRVEISRRIHDFPVIPEEICPLLARADMMQALARLGKETGCQLVQPNHKTELDLWAARHPLLCERFAEARAEVLELAEPDDNHMVHFTLCLLDKIHGMVISGANTGGKTVTLKTTGLLAWMANSGIPVPVDEGSRIPFYGVILADIGDNQSLSHNLSTFASHLANIKQVLDAPKGTNLVLLDELGSGTDPAEGNALAAAIIEEMVARGNHLLITTHQQILCTMALTHAQLDNGSMIFDPRLHRPTYRFTQGVPGRSHALDIARSAGLPEHILDEAHKLVDENMVDIQAAIRTLQQQNKEMDKQKQKLRRDELRLHRRIKEAREEANSFKREKEVFKEKSRIRLQKEVEKAERELRSTLQKVSSSKARTAMATFAKTRNEVLEPYATPEKVTEEEIQSTGLDPTQWKAGDKVYLRTWRKTGLLQSVGSKKARVDVGGMKMEVHLSDLDHQGKAEARQGRITDHLEESSDLALSMELRLLGFRVEDALLEVDQTIDRALRKGIPFVKVIHGHGHGTLKSAIREFLGKHMAKTSFEVVLDPENDGTTEIKFT